jgi:hypothetical protein
VVDRFCVVSDPVIKCKVSDSAWFKNTVYLKQGILNPGDYSNHANTYTNADAWILAGRSAINTQCTNPTKTAAKR